MILVPQNLMEMIVILCIQSEFYMFFFNTKTVYLSELKLVIMKIDRVSHGKNIFHESTF